jgi:hypothetical protein
LRAIQNLFNTLRRGRGLNNTDFFETVFSMLKYKICPEVFSLKNDLKSMNKKNFTQFVKEERSEKCRG